MGLDITAYEKVTLVRAMTVQQANAEDYDPGARDETLLYVDHHVRTQHDGMAEGAYAYSGARVAFRAGSYGGYNRWRDHLADLVGVPRAGTEGEHSGPFAEMIHFSDCEGFIGPETSAKLAADFAAWRDRAAAKFDQYGLAVYDDWARAFAIASKGGAVQFH